MKKPLSPIISAYLAKLGQSGGRAAVRRHQWTSSTARAAAKTRWKAAWKAASSATEKEKE